MAQHIPYSCQDEGKPPVLGVKHISPRHREIMRRVVEGARHTDIAAHMGMEPESISLIVNSPLVRAEIDKMMEERDEAVTSRLDNLSGEATDRIKNLMRNANSQMLQARMAESILDRAGYGKVDKKIVAVVGGDEVIKSLNRRRAEEADGAREDPGEGAIPVEANGGSDTGVEPPSDS